MQGDPTERAIERLAEAMMEPLGDVGRLLAGEIDKLRAEVFAEITELRAEFVAHRNDVDYAHKV